MIRFIDLRHHEEDLGGERFAFWNTVVDEFVKDAMGCQAWAVMSEFDAGDGDDGYASRCASVAPEWAHRPAERRAEQQGAA